MNSFPLIILSSLLRADRNRTTALRKVESCTIFHARYDKGIAMDLDSQISHKIDPVALNCMTSGVKLLVPFQEGHDQTSYGSIHVVYLHSQNISARPSTFPSTTASQRKHTNFRARGEHLLNRMFPAFILSLKKLDTLF